MGGDAVAETGLCFRPFCLRLLGGALAALSAPKRAARDFVKSW